MRHVDILKESVNSIIISKKKLKNNYVALYKILDYTRIFSIPSDFALNKSFTMGVYKNNDKSKAMGNKQRGSSCKPGKPHKSRQSRKPCKPRKSRKSRPQMTAAERVENDRKKCPIIGALPVVRTLERPAPYHDRAKLRELGYVFNRTSKNSSGFSMIYGTSLANKNLRPIYLKDTAEPLLQSPNTDNSPTWHTYHENHGGSSLGDQLEKFQVEQALTASSDASDIKCVTVSAAGVTSSTSDADSDLQHPFWTPLPGTLAHYRQPTESEKMLDGHWCEHCCARRSAAFCILCDV